MRNTLPLIVVLVACTLPLACSRADRQPTTTAPAQDVARSPSAPPLAADAPQSLTSLSPSLFASALKQPDAVLLDVRTPAEYAAGHLPGAVNLDVQSPDFARRAAALDPAKNYLVYCRSGSRSARACAQMSPRLQCQHLAGGITAWQSANLPVEK